MTFALSVDDNWPANSVLITGSCGMPIEIFLLIDQQTRCFLDTADLLDTPKTEQRFHFTIIFFISFFLFLFSFSIPLFHFY